jgi:hypothetical protein
MIACRCVVNSESNSACGMSSVHSAATLRADVSAASAPLEALASTFHE